MRGMRGGCMWFTTVSQGQCRFSGLAAHLKTCEERYTMPSSMPSGAVPLMSRKLKAAQIRHLALHMGSYTVQTKYRGCLTPAVHRALQKRAQSSCDALCDRFSGSIRSEHATISV